MRGATGDNRGVTHRRLILQLRHVIAVHGARAVHTALGGVAGIVTANVGMTSAEIEHEGVYDAERFVRDVRDALMPIGVELIAVEMIQDRMLPLA